LISLIFTIILLVIGLKLMDRPCAAGVEVINSSIVDEIGFLQI